MNSTEDTATEDTMNISYLRTSIESTIHKGEYIMNSNKDTGREDTTTF